MPSLKNYPTDGLDLQQAQKLIENLNQLGGTSSKGLFAEKIGMTETSGPFRGKISSLGKYKLIKITLNEILISELGKKIINSYNEKDEKELMFEALNNIQLFNELLGKYGNSKLNTEILDKVLVREYGLSQKSAIKLKKSFITSTQYLGILRENGTFDYEFIKQLEKNQEQRKKEIKHNQNLKTTEEAQEIGTVIHKSNIASESLSEKQNLDSQKIIPNITEDLFHLIMFFGSLLKDEIEREEIPNILERNNFLSHTKLVYRVINKKLDEREISADELDALIDALKVDLRIT